MNQDIINKFIEEQAQEGQQLVRELSESFKNTEEIASKAENFELAAKFRNARLAMEAMTIQDYRDVVILLMNQEKEPI